MSSIKYKAGFKYQLVKDYHCIISIKPKQVISTTYISLTKQGLLTIRQGYAWDGPSGPSIDTKTFMRGSLVHDALYQLMRSSLLHPARRLEADKILKKICLEDGMCSFRAWYVYEALRWEGSAAADPKNKKRTLTAP